MAGYFKAGTIDIGSGVSELTVTGLALDFSPSSAVVNVRQPTTDAPIIDAYVTGSLTTDGFSVVLSAATESTGYKLDYIVSNTDETQPVDYGTLAADYLTIRREVACYLGYDADALSNAQKAEIDRYIQSGLRQFYYPPMIDGVDPNFEWDFLRSEGSVQTTANTSDYLLPDGFGHLNGHLVFGDAEARKSVPVIPYGSILRMLNSDPNRRGRPTFAATLAQSTYGQKGQRTKLYLFPTPDREYTLKFTCSADTGKIGETGRTFPCGGPMYAELVIESCLAIAEQKANDDVGAHTQKFNQLLVSLINKSRKALGQDFGSIGDPDAFQW